MGNSTSKKLRLAAIREMSAGMVKHYAGQTLAMNGTTVKVDDLVAMFDAYEAQAAATAAAEAAWKVQLAAEDTLASTKVTPAMQQLRRFLLATLGPQSPVLADFGVLPLRFPSKTVKAKVATIEKGAATRLARHTMSKKQKAAIHGAPAPAPATPTPAAVTPAVAPGNGGTPNK